MNKKMILFGPMVVATLVFCGCGEKFTFETKFDDQRIDCYQLHESEQERCFDRLDRAPLSKTYEKDREDMRNKKP
ncbi:hypothetical protein [Desulfobotulus mexicanus]|uniref:Lipoprotein n=1 Tax=Desulfobotulus mexicanus TaxID=2586642 RepID=A0A5S5MC77_9BACT|nr:hypothetical protein [Desulfobotulus mexicanus]TYT73312.1 hypothetical protein FIM25_15865 [Desulfobotulus mexicanus]